MVVLKGNHLAFLTLFIPGLLSLLVRCGGCGESQNHQYFTALIKVSGELSASQLVPFPKQAPGIISRGHRERNGSLAKVGAGEGEREGDQAFIYSGLPVRTGQRAAVNSLELAVGQERGKGAASCALF